MEQEEIWNKIAEPWQKYRKKAPEEVSEFLKNKKGKVLDLGCGSGRNIIANPNIQYYGVDFSEEMLKYAEKDSKKKKANAVFFKSGLDSLPFNSDFFDSAIFISALHCIETEKNRLNALKELYRVLKKDAEAMITVWDKASNREFAEKNVKSGYLKWKENSDEYERYYYFYDKEELEKILREIGFKDIKITHQALIQGENQHSKKNFIFYVKK
jgi:ubiquinone/menaquinone biosynthesis C-methylase UbiE